MHEINNPETTKHVVAHNGNDVYHYCVVESQNYFRTGQPYMEIFDSEEEAKKAFPQCFSTEEQLEEFLNQSLTADGGIPYVADIP